MAPNPRRAFEEALEHLQAELDTATSTLGFLSTLISDIDQGLLRGSITTAGVQSLRAEARDAEERVDELVRRMVRLEDAIEDFVRE